MFRRNVRQRTEASGSRSPVIRQSRRAYLKGVGTVGILGSAGCLGGAAVGGGNGGWPPARNIVENLTPGDSTTTSYLLSTMWLNAAEPHYEDDITLTQTTNPSRVVQLNTLKDREPDGSSMGVVRPGTASILQITSGDEVRWTLDEFTPLFRYDNGSRGIQMNPRTLPVEDHFDITWDEFIDYSVDSGPVRIAAANSAHVLLQRLLRDSEPRLSEDDWNIIEVPGGGEARAAMQRGELDIYQGSFDGHMNREEFYYTQFCILDPDRYPDLAAMYEQVEPGEGDPAGRTLADNPQAYLSNTSLPADSSRKVIDIIVDFYMQFLPPDTPDDIVQIHEDAFRSASEDSALEERIVNTFSPANFLPLFGDRAREAFDAKYASMVTDEEVSSQILELF